NIFSAIVVKASLGSTSINLAKGTTYTISRTVGSSTSYTLTFQPEHITFAGYLPTTSSSYSYEFFGKNTLSQSLDKSSITIPVNVAERNPDASIVSVTPSSISSLPATITVLVNNTGNVPFSVVNASATGGYDAKITKNANYPISPGISLPVNIEVSNGNGPFTLSLTIDPTPAFSCAGSQLANFSVTTTTIQGIAGDLSSGLEGPREVTVPDNNPIIQDYNATLVFDGIDSNTQGQLYIDIRPRLPTTGATRITKTETLTIGGTGVERVPFNITCNNEFQIYDINITADPNNNIVESDETNNAYTSTVTCKAPLACNAVPRDIVVMPGFPATTQVECNFYDSGGNLLTVPCSQPSSNPATIFVDNEAFQSLLDDVEVDYNSNRYVDLIFTPKSSISPSSGESTEYIVDLNITGQRRSIGGTSQDIAYTCPINVTVFNAPCTYYI
ncbi:MAG: hypothetical protein D6769_03795, partial [Methanobacteriota archaeon]